VAGWLSGNNGTSTITLTSKHRTELVCSIDIQVVPSAEDI